MPTTALVIEQILSGSLVLVTVVLLVIGRLPALPSDEGRLTVFASAFVGAAYLVGVIYDRFSDTLLEDLDRHNRLQIGLQDPGPGSRTDVFREDLFTVTILASESPAAGFANYLRSRIRILRMTAAVLPALGMAWTVSLLSQHQRPFLVVAAYAVVLVYGVAFVGKLVGLARAPRTDAGPEVVESYRETWASRNGLCAFVADWPTSLGLAALTTIGFAIGSLSEQRHLSVVPPAAAVLTMLTGWGWWRVSKTYRTLLRSFYVLQRGQT